MLLPLQNFKTFIGQHALFTSKDKVLLAVSGGKDSVLMVHLFKLLGNNFGIAHCNFNLRAEESQRDEDFVRELALNLGVSFHFTNFDTLAYAASHQVSTQMAARTLRYDWFEQIRQAEDYQLIALAQHQDDAIETVLLNLTRGTGIAGLHGILPKRGHLIRPLLFLSRNEIEQLIAEHNIAYVEDSSNSSTKYARNKLRLKVIPQLKELNPNLEQTFAHNIQRFAETEQVLQKVVADLSLSMLDRRNDTLHISLNKIEKLAPQTLLLFELLKPFSASEFLIAEILQSLGKQSGTSFFSHTHRFTIDRSDLIVSPLLTAAGENQLQMIHSNDSRVAFAGQEIQISNADCIQFEKNEARAYVDTAKLLFPLVLRSRQPGDKFKPIGMKGFKKLSDYLIDEKIPLSVKDQVPVLINGNGEIIWIAGLRQDERYRITSLTKTVTIFELRSLHITISKQS
ncbi:tRNA lysidine(34) synthetase TilS [Pedobacter sp. MC2016-24]|uniref:tRNA lysidine(34) synthetase TilS n=1 Tax=Pedobacter sp. MC2016-24 TaxID=2780090 RepID=UPI0018819B5D|nr:tRNA lysidine(34) synthetase TilS [Pedobacter sp. MC2016-24]MBE9599123.1 tRNA lysidine(34) synthetase TilS [Pedobacter sp. MC2016-24]